MSHTPVSQRLCQFVKSIQPASKGEVLGLLFNILEEGIVKVYYSHMFILIKQSEKSNMRNKTYSKPLKSPHV